MSPSGQFIHAGLVWDWSTAEYAPGKLYVFLQFPGGYEEHIGECLDTEDPERIARRHAEAEMAEVEHHTDLREVLADLIDWAASMGGFEAEVWDRARAALDQTREVPA
jgi:hypothetical protein